MCVLVGVGRVVEMCVMVGVGGVVEMCVMVGVGRVVEMCVLVGVGRVVEWCVVVVERGVVVIDGPGIFSSVGSVVLQRRGINTVEHLKPKT